MSYRLEQLNPFDPKYIFKVEENNKKCFPPQQGESYGSVINWARSPNNALFLCFNEANALVGHIGITYNSTFGTFFPPETRVSDIMLKHMHCIWNVCVNEGFRNRSICKIMVSLLVRQTLQTSGNILSVFGLSVLRNNGHAKKCYEANGFIYVGSFSIFDYMVADFTSSAPPPPMFAPPPMLAPPASASGPPASASPARINVKMIIFGHGNASNQPPNQPLPNFHLSTSICGTISLGSNEIYTTLLNNFIQDQPQQLPGCQPNIHPKIRGSSSIFIQRMNCLQNELIYAIAPSFLSDKNPITPVTGATGRVYYQYPEKVLSGIEKKHRPFGAKIIHPKFKFLPHGVRRTKLTKKSVFETLECRMAPNQVEIYSGMNSDKSITGENASKDGTLMKSILSDFNSQYNIPDWNPENPYVLCMFTHPSLGTNAFMVPAPPNTLLSEIIAVTADMIRRTYAFEPHFDVIDNTCSHSDSYAGGRRLRSTHRNRRGTHRHRSSTRGKKTHRRRN